MIRSTKLASGSFAGSDSGEDTQYLRFLLHAGELLFESLDYHKTLREICAAAVETVADICILDLLENDRLMLVSAMHRDPSLVSIVRQAGAFLVSDPGRPKHPCFEVVRSGRAFLVAEIDDRYIEEASTSVRHAEFMRMLGYRSVMYVPINTQSQGVLGSMTLVRTSGERPLYTNDSLLFAEDLARRCGSAIAKAKLHAQTLDIAMRFQRSALPKGFPRVEGFSFDSYYEPAAKAQLVGGDWYDAFPLSEDRIAITIGDALGHGIESSILMNSLRNCLRSALYGGLSFSQTLDIADRIVRDESPNSFATALVALIDIKEQHLSCLSAGHPGPLLWTGCEDEVLDPFIERGLPLGLRSLSASPAIPVEIPLLEEHFVVFFSDGLLEWNHDIEGTERTIRRAMCDPEIRRAAHPALEIRRAVIGETHPDDVAILTVRKR